MKFLVGLFAFVNILIAHPHTFINIFPTIYSSSNHINKINIEWHFDEMTSELLMMEFDQNYNNKIDSEEIAYIQENYFNVLELYSYYINIKIYNKNTKIDPMNFNVFIKDKRYIVYVFDIFINRDKRGVEISFYDEDMFTAFVLKNSFIKSNINFNIVNLDADYYVGYILEFN